ncbi:uncharacterized protein LOC134918777 isoform X2 [Pseudophryne corroboree]
MQGHGRVYKLIWNHYMKDLNKVTIGKIIICFLNGALVYLKRIKKMVNLMSKIIDQSPVPALWITVIGLSFVLTNIPCFYCTFTLLKEECEKTFFDCYVRELKVIEEELNLFGVHNRSAIINKIHHIEHNIQVAIQITESMTANCNKCEQYEEKPIEEFKKSFVTLTQKMQSNANGKK